jgi:hypothetical protein
LKLEHANALNVFLPGAGLFYLGHRLVGACLAGAFLGCFTAILTVFGIGYYQYLRIALSEDLLKGDNLEQAGASFHQGWLLGLAALGMVLYLISAVLYSIAKRKWKTPAAP